MALNIKSPRTERLAAEVARMTGETKTEAIRRALEERMGRLALRSPRVGRVERLRGFLEQEVWPTLPREVREKPLSRDEREAVLGYGKDGV